MRFLSDIFSSNLKQLRKDKDYTQKELSYRAGLSSGMIGDIESGRRNPTLTTIEKIALALDVPAYTLLIDSKKIEEDGKIEENEDNEEYSRIIHLSLDGAF